MWVRSQNKEVLVNAKSFYLRKYNNYYRVQCEYDYLGDYPDKKDALSVLEMLTTFIEGLEHSKATNTSAGSYVFQMPVA